MVTNLFSSQTTDAELGFDVKSTIVYGRMMEQPSTHENARVETRRYCLQIVVDFYLNVLPSPIQINAGVSVRILVQVWWQIR